MSSVPVTFDGVLYDLHERTTQRVVFIGDASLSGIGIGGGPIIPPPSGGQPPDGGKPPGIWGPGDPRPNPPIANAPGVPGYQPPLVIPPPPQGPPPSHILPPPPSGGWAYVEPWGWGYFPAPGAPPQGGGQPPQIWGPTDPRPSNPIPIYPGGGANPPQIWGPNDPRPTNPIANVPGIVNPNPPPTDPTVPPVPPDTAPDASQQPVAGVPQS